MTAHRSALLLLLPLLAGCAGTAGPTPSVEPAAGPPQAPDPRSCIELLGDPDALGRLAVEAATLRDPADGLERGASERPGCRLVVGAVHVADLRLLPQGIVELEGERPDGRRQRVNPRRRELEARLRELEEDGRGGERRRPPGTGDPLLDVVGLLGSAVIGLVAEAASGSEAASLRAELERTPVYVEEPATAPYRYEAQAFRLVAEGSAEVALVDAATGLGWEGAVPFRIERLYAIPLTRDPRDTTRPEGVVLVADRRELERLARAPLPLTAAELAAGLVHLAQGAPRPVDLAELARRQALQVRPAAGTLAEAAPTAVPGSSDVQNLSDNAAAALDPARLPRAASRSVVRIRDGGRTPALAVYVAPELLLTVAHALPDGSLIPVEDAEGRLSYALVERSDPLTDLALLWVPREGPPLPLADRAASGGESAAEQQSGPELWLPEQAAPERLGAPVVLEGRLLAVVREDRTRPWELAPAPLIRRLLDRGGAEIAAPTRQAAASPR